jgi:hypothetical protein
MRAPQDEVGTLWTKPPAMSKLPDRLSASERAMLMGGACAKGYGWELKKG